MDQDRNRTNGKIYYGKSGFAGEFGHTTLFENEILCQCGKRGCLETEASRRALTDLFVQRLKELDINNKPAHPFPSAVRSTPSSSFLALNEYTAASRSFSAS